MTVNRFERTRRDHSQEQAEDYVELVDALIKERGEARAVELAARLGISHVAVTKTVQRLQRDGLLRSEPYRSIFLTPEGALLAQSAKERHQLVLAFLKRLGVSDETANVDAEGIEHHISEETLQALRRFLAEGGTNP